MNTHIHNPPIPIPGTDLEIVRHEPEGQTLILSDGRGLYVPDLADPADTDAALAAALAALTAPLPPPAPVPASVTQRQLRQWLITTHRIAAVETALGAIPDETQRALARNWWDYANQFERAHPLINQIAALLGMTPTEVDEGLRTAAAL